MFDITPFTNYIYLGIAIPSILVALKIVFNSPYLKEKAKAQTVEKKTKLKGQSMTEKLHDYIENGPSHIAQIDKEMQKLRESGVKEEQMGHLKFEKDALEKLQHPVVQMLADPIMKIAGKYAKGLGIEL